MGTLLLGNPWVLFYLLYVGANELRTYGGWGHTSLGIARSTDLVTWEVP